MKHFIILTTTPHLFPDLEPENDSLQLALEKAGISYQFENWHTVATTYHLSQLKNHILVFRTVWDYPDYLIEFTSFLEKLKKYSIPTINPIEILEWNINKSYLLELQEANLPVVPVTFVPKNTTIAPLSYETVLKPAVGLGAIGATRIPPNTNITADTDSILTPYRKNITKGELSILVINSQTELIIRKTPSKQDWRVQPQYGGRYNLEEEAPEEAIKVAKDLFKYLSSKFSNTYFMYMRIDLILNDEESWEILEFEAIDPSFYGQISTKAVDALSQQLLLF